MKLSSLLFLVLMLVALPVRAAQSMPPLVDVAWLMAQPVDATPVLLDIQPVPYYRQVHLAGAVNLPFDAWRGAIGKVQGMLPPVARLEELLGQVGIASDDRVVIVTTGLGAGDMAAAARVYWTFKVLGHRQVAILNGGLSAVAADERAATRLTDRPATRPMTRYQARPDMSLVADAQDTQVAQQAGEVLVDARSAAEFLGIHVGGEGERPGTLPGAHNLPFEWLTENGSGQLLPAERVARLLGTMGIDAQAPQVHFCHSGNRAALTWFVSYALLGNHKARLYDASMLEWATRADLPMERRVQF